MGHEFLKDLECCNFRLGTGGGVFFDLSTVSVSSNSITKSGEDSLRFTWFETLSLVIFLEFPELMFGESISYFKSTDSPTHGLIGPAMMPPTITDHERKNNVKNNADVIFHKITR